MPQHIVLVLNQAAFGGMVSWRENVTTKRAQDPAVHCIFLRKEFFRSYGIFAETSLGFEDLDFHFVTLNQVDEIDVYREDSLYADEKLYQAGKSKVPNKWQPTAWHFLRVSGTGSILRTWQSLRQLLTFFSSDPYKSPNSFLMATLNLWRTSFSYSLQRRLNSATGGLEGSYRNLGY